MRRELVQSRTGVTMCDGCCYKVGQLFFYKVRRELLQSRTGVTMCDGCCYKGGQVLQSETNVVKWDDF